MSFMDWSRQTATPTNVESWFILITFWVTIQLSRYILFIVLGVFQFPMSLFTLYQNILRNQISLFYYGHTINNSTIETLSDYGKALSSGWCSENNDTKPAHTTSTSWKKGIGITENTFFPLFWKKTNKKVCRFRKKHYLCNRIWRNAPLEGLLFTCFGTH